MIIVKNNKGYYFILIPTHESQYIYDHMDSSEIKDYDKVLVFANFKLIFNSKLSLCLHLPLHQLPKTYLYPNFYYYPSLTWTL